MPKRIRRLPDPETRENPTKDRDAAGHFIAGNSVGKTGGRPRSRTAIDDAVRSTLTDDEIRAVIRRLHASAMHGSIHAAKELLDRLVGRPRFCAEPIDGGDDDGPEFDDLALEVS